MDTYDYLRRQRDDRIAAGAQRSLKSRRICGAYLHDDDGNRWVNFGGNDYLGLAAGRSAGGDDATASHRSVPTDAHDHTMIPCDHAAEAAVTGPIGSASSALVCGWTASHRRLAATIAAFESTPCAVVFPSGYAACSGAAATFPRPGDVIFSDQLNHASLIDGCRLSGADKIVYPHADIRWLNEALIRHRRRYRHAWIITDTIFSMDGTIAPLEALCDLADRHHTHLLVDEAHGTGVFGDSGSGICQELGLQQRIEVRIGTLSKSIAVQGGFVAGPEPAIDHLINHCRALIFSTSLSPRLCDAATAAITQVRHSGPARRHVRDLSTRLREGLGLSSAVVSSTAGRLADQVPIVPVILGDEVAAVAAADRLATAGFYVPAIRPPTVPDGTARLRISVSAAHTPDMIDALIEALIDVTGR